MQEAQSISLLSRIREMPAGVQQEAMVFAASLGANVLDYLVHMVISRGLGPSDYSIVTSLLAVFMILTLPPRHCGR